METADFFREKAQQCRTMAAGTVNAEATARRLLALALELDARALALQAGDATAREIEIGADPRPDGNGGAA